MFRNSIIYSVGQLGYSCQDLVDQWARTWTFVQELLVATRHVLATDFRRGFFSQIDTLLDERLYGLYFPQVLVWFIGSFGHGTTLVSWIISPWLVVSTFRLVEMENVKGLCC